MHTHPELRAIMPSAKLLHKETPFSKHHPIRRFTRKGAMVTRNGDLVGVIELRGIQHETASDKEVTAAHAALARLAAHFGDGRTAIYTHAIRRRVDLAGSIASIEGDGFEAQMDRQYRAQLQEQQAYRLRHFVTIVRHQPIVGNAATNQMLRWGQKKMPGLARLIGVDLEDLEDQALERRNFNAFTTAMKLAEEALSPFEAKRFTGSNEDRAEVMSFLGMIGTGLWEPAAPVIARVNEHAAQGRITFAEDWMSTRDRMNKPARATGMFWIHGYPTWTDTSMFDELLSAPVEFIATQCFRPLDRLAGAQKIRDTRKSRDDADDEAASLTTALNDALDAVASDTLSVGHHHYTLSVIASSHDELEEVMPGIESKLLSSNLKVRRETLGLELAWWAQTPGNLTYQARAKKRFVHNRNFADFATAHNWSAGDSKELSWGGPVQVYRTSGNTPFYFSFQREGDAGENGPGTTAMYGAPGEGKTFFMNTLLASTARLPIPPDVILFDKDRGSEPFIRAIGGRYITLGAGNNLGFNPFSVAADPEGAEWLEGFIARLAQIEELTPEQERRLASAARRNAEAPPNLHNFRTFVELLRSADDAGAAKQLMDGLSGWYGAGDRAWLFDNKEDAFSMDQRITAFDMTPILENERIRSAILDYLFFRIQRRLKQGRPTIIVLDEAWRLLDDPRFAERIRDWIKTIRKLNGIVCFMTQEPEDAVKASISDVLIQSTENSIFFPNPQASEDTYCGKFRLSKDELACVRGMTPKCRSILFKSSRDSILLNTRLDADPGILKVLSGTAKSVQEMDRLLATYGEDGWLEPFMNPDHSHLKEISA